MNRVIPSTRALLPFAMLVLFLAALTGAGNAWALSSTNIPLDSPIYSYLEKLASFGLITGDIAGIRPYSRAEAARLTLEAEQNLIDKGDDLDQGVVAALLAELHRTLSRELHLLSEPENIPAFAAKPLSSFKVRYVFLDGVARSYERPVHDPGGDGVFGIGAGLRPDNSYPTLAHQHGSEGTPLLENNEGIRYSRGSNYEIRFSSEAFAGDYASALVEPLLLVENNGNAIQGKLDKGYLKIGGKGLELLVGRDSNWLGQGYRGNITLTNNAENFDQIKLSSPEPLTVKYLGLLKYALIFSRFDETVTDGETRHPFFLAAKIVVKPTANLEIGINLGRQVGGAGVSNTFGSTLRGLLGGTSADNSNSLAGLEFRYRVPYLRNLEIYGEFSGEDTASFWPIVESYVAGIYIPRLTADGKDDFRFEYYFGNSILYTNGTFPEGYLYHGLPVGHSQGGAAEEFYCRYSHWFGVRNNVALEYIHGERGNLGRVTVDNSLQAVERKDSWRGSWTLPLGENVNFGFMYGVELVRNMNLVSGENRTNQLLKGELTYLY
jgi:hypothetical protein